MPTNKQLTVEALGSVAQDASLRVDSLNVVAVRLLAVAVRGLSVRTVRLDQARLTVPQTYHLWPMVEAEAEAGRSRQELKIYVCPKGASSADDERFPVGTVFVVETLALANGGGGRVASIFVMEKFASIDAHGRSNGYQDVWVYAMYDSVEQALARGSAACGVCRLSVM